ncbi:hypothetical protein [Nocardia sp. NPDC019395]|uniref:hypothetical protein n=1 Tax=Nocardia sp. NPDC019395 TaxID=3154686 RepID=UPI0033D4EDFE
MAIENNVSEEPDHTRELWPRPTNPILRKLNPGRALRRWRVNRAIRFEYRGPALTEGDANERRAILFFHRDHPDVEIGKVLFLICHECRWGHIGNVSVQKRFWGNGIASRALAEIRDPLPGYTWRTSLHKTTAKSFWLLIAERTGKDYADIGRYCDHMYPDQARH